MSTLTDFLAAIEHGAASVYHAVLGTGTEIAAWGSDPSVAPLLSVGAAVANTVLNKVGVSATAVETDVVNGLKAIAAADPTVPSTGSISALVNLGGAIASAIAPGIAGTVAAVEGAVGLAEGLVSAVTTTTTTTTTAPPSAA
jgi:hypothetical protein